ncbi:hypothetical protein Ciccas_010185 [Cichlidogyrus casuarinus]|uniref:Uncharacterized protein n=1 Tax=Cichlidogyrus casuarinus TaxID=1844966 RepID=A0ABD2PUU8_9PLAT
MRSSWKHSDDVNQCFDARLTQSRYHLHHHAVNHKPGKSIKKMATISHNLDKSNSTGLLRRSVSSGNFFRNKSKGSTSYLKDKTCFSKLGHDMTLATCSRYYGDCETCGRCVHGHKYFYCKNCPVVLHKTANCIQNLTRGCPSQQIRVFGWGECESLIITH